MVPDSNPDRIASPRADSSASSEHVGIHRSPMDLLRKALAPFKVVLKVMADPKVEPAALQHALTKVHQRMLLATLANHSGFTSLILCT